MQRFARRHVARGTWRRPTHDLHHHRSGGSVHRTVPPPSRSVHPFGRHVPKCLNTHTHTHRHTDKHIRPNFFSPTPQWEFPDAKSMLKHTLDLPILDNSLSSTNQQFTYHNNVSRGYIQSHRGQTSATIRPVYFYTGSIPTGHVILHHT